MAITQSALPMCRLGSVHMSWMDIRGHLGVLLFTRLAVTSLHLVVLLVKSVSGT